MALSSTTVASAVPCPDDQPSWIEGRFTVWEPNLGERRGLGEVFAYAYERGESTEGTRFIAVSSMDGAFCIESTTPGDWVMTVFEPFSWRPIVRELTCPEECDLGEVHLDTAYRVSDDYVDFGEGWYSDAFAQTFVAPEGSLWLVKATFRSGNPNTIPIELHAGEMIGEPRARSVLRIDGPGGRDSAIFAPETAPLSAGERFTIVGRGGWAPWRVTGGDPSGQMHVVTGDGSLEPIADVDLAVNLDIDGVDGNVTSHLYTNSDTGESGGTVVQGFVARSSSITHASVFTGPPDGLRRMRASIAETPDGPAIGPTKETRGLQQQGVAFAWHEGDVPVEPGRTYYLRIEYDAPHVTYVKRRTPLDEPVPLDGRLTVDGRDVSGALWGRILGPVARPEPPVDAGVDAGGADAGAVARDTSPAPDAEADGGTMAIESDGCACSTAPDHASLAWALMCFCVVRRGRA